MKKYKKIYVPNSKLGVSSWIPPVNPKFCNVDIKSWFNIDKFDNPQPKKIKSYSKTIPEIPLESYKQQMKTIKRRKINKLPVFLHAKKIRLYPTKNQKLILDKWFNAFAHMFNITIAFLRKHIKIKKDSNIDTFIKFSNFEKTRKALNEEKNKIISNMKKSDRVAAHILDEAIALAVSNCKTCLSNLKAGNIKHFRIRELKKNRRKKIIKIEPGYFTNNTFCCTRFPIMRSSEKLNNITKTTTLQYNYDTKKYILLVPKEVKIEKVIKNKLSCGIDLGVRTFATVYSDVDISSICDNSGSSKYIRKLHKKIDSINKNLKNNNINRTNGIKGLRKYHLKITNKVTDMHFKVAYEIVNTYDKVFIGKLSTKKILSKNNVTINRKTKRMIGVLSPYLFRQRLSYMGAKYGSKVVEVDEYLTTKTCSNCGKINELGSLKIHKCKCGMTSDRDVNAAKNILKIGLTLK